MKKILALAFLLLTAAVHLPAVETPDPLDTALSPSERLEALIARVRASHERMETMEASFLQRKESMMLAEPAEATGVFSYSAPDRVRWEYLQPDPISLLIAGDTVTMWYRDLERAEVGDVGSRAQRVLELMGASTSLDTLLEYFSVSLRLPPNPEEPFLLTLSPRFKRVERRVRKVTIWVDSGRYLPFRLRFVEGDGDVTEYEFSDLRINEDLPQERFTLDLPPEVEVGELRLDQQSSGR